MKKKPKNIIISGSNSGLGLFLSKKFILDGHNLILLSRKNNKKKLFKQNIDQKINYIVLNLENKKSIDEGCKKIRKLYTEIDLVINCAGVQGPIGLFHKNNFNIWKKSININLINTAYFIRQLIINHKKKISLVINLSGGGSSNSRKYFSSYSISKTGIVRLTENLAEEYKKYKIRFIAIAPGVLKTKMYFKSVIKDKIKSKKVDFADKNKTYELIKFTMLKKNNYMSGKLISAIWDDWKSVKFINSIRKNNNFLTLRRILIK